MSRTLRLSRDQIRRFAETSGDHNPLHVDETFARATPYGRCIAQGALATIAALGSVAQTTLEHAGSLQMKFAQPIFPDEEYEFALAEPGTETAEVEISRRGRVVATVTVTLEPDRRALGIGRAPSPSEAPRTSPASQSLEELVSSGLSLEEPYGCDVDGLYALASELGAGEVPRTILVWLAAASFTVGMLVPGRDSVFASARLSRSDRFEAGVLNVTVTTADDRTGLVVVDVDLGAGQASATMTLSTFLRQPVPEPSRASIGRFLAPSAVLSGSTVLVVGGSRGLGAALSGAFATQGAGVYAGFAESQAYADRLEAEFGVRPLRFDATDSRQVRQALAVLRAEAGSLDGVVFCAAPTLYESSLDPSSSEAALEFVRSSLAMVLHPLAEALPWLAPDGWLVVISSSDLEDPREGWLQYTIAKAALEGVAAYCHRHTSASVLVARPPKMWTDSTNTPLGRLGAVPAEQVAAAIVRWATSDAGTRPGLLSGEELVDEPLSSSGT